MLRKMSVTWRAGTQKQRIAVGLGAAVRRWVRKEVKPLDRSTEHNRRAQEGVAPRTLNRWSQLKKDVGH